MSRPIRIEYEGAFYHIIQRGLEKRDICREDRDKAKLIEYIEHAYKAYGAKIHAYCILSNHYHFIIETPRANITKIMHSINTSYAVFYNKRHRRVGPLFQGRYKSIIVQDDDYLWKLSSYIHNNPVRAKITKKAEDYKWSSYASYIGAAKKEPNWLERDYILNNFGKGRERQKRYKRFVEGNILGKDEVAKDTKMGFVYGSIDFSKFIIETYLKDRIEDKEIREIYAIRKELEPDSIQIKNIVKKHVKSGEKEQKKIEIYLLRKYTSKGNGEISRGFEGIGKHGVSKIYTRVRDSRENDKKIDKTLRRIETCLEDMSIV